MDRAVLSIHLLGAAYDPFSERVITLAADLDQQLIFWIATGADTATDERQRLLIDAIRRGVQAREPTDECCRRAGRCMPDTGVRRLIDAVLTKLRPQAVTAKPAAPPAATTPTVYIVHDATTAEDTRVALLAEGTDRTRRRRWKSSFLARTCPASPN